jgi:hypothetical protein
VPTPPRSTVAYASTMYATGLAHDLGMADGDLLM